MVLLDIKNHTISRNGKSSEPQKKKNNKIKSYGLQQYCDGMQKEVYPNGIEYSLANGEITEIKLPNGIRINPNKQSISWNNRIHWYANSEKFKVLQTETGKVLTDRNLRVSEFITRNKTHRFRTGSNLLLDNKHVISIGRTGLLQEFKFKTGGTVLQNRFKHTPDGYDVISLAGGTNVLQRGKMMVVAHGNQTLSYDTRREFAATYGSSNVPPQQLLQRNNIR